VADEFLDLLEYLRRTAGRDHARRHVLVHHRPGPDQAARPDLHARQDGGVTADRDIVGHGRAEHALLVPRTHRMRVVGEYDAGAEEYPLAKRDVLQEAVRVDPGTVADPVTRFDDGVCPDRAAVADAVVLPD